MNSLYPSVTIGQCLRLELDRDAAQLVLDALDIIQPESDEAEDTRLCLVEMLTNAIAADEAETTADDEAGFDEAGFDEALWTQRHAGNLEA